MSTFSDSVIPSYRSSNVLGFLLSALSLAIIAIYIEPLADLENCALCSSIRLALTAMAGLFFLAILINRSVFFQRFLALLHFLIIGTTLVTIVRNLLSKAELTSACEVSTSELLSGPGASSGVLALLDNAVKCPGPDWQLYGLSFAHLGLILFVILLLVVWKIMLKKPKRKSLF